MGFLFIVHIWCSHYAFSHSLAGIFSDCGINHLANQKHKWREVISFFWTMGKNIWLLRQDLAGILFMWHYILYLEFYINCCDLIEGIECPVVLVKSICFMICSWWFPHVMSGVFVVSKMELKMQAVF